MSAAVFGKCRVQRHNFLGSYPRPSKRNIHIYYLDCFCFRNMCWYHRSISLLSHTCVGPPGYPEAILGDPTDAKAHRLKIWQLSPRHLGVSETRQTAHTYSTQTVMWTGFLHMYSSAYWYSTHAFNYRYYRHYRYYDYYVTPPVMLLPETFEFQNNILTGSSWITFDVLMWSEKARDVLYKKLEEEQRGKRLVCSIFSLNLIKALMLLKNVHESSYFVYNIWYIQIQYK